MNGEWQSRSTVPASAKIAALLLVLVGIGFGFALLEQDRTRKLMARSMHVHRRHNGTIDLVLFKTDKVTRRHWDELRPASHTLQTLHLSRTTSVAGGLAAVGEFTNLASLYLIGCAWADDEQLQRLAGLRLTHLNLQGTLVTDRGLAAIDLSRLRVLDLSGCSGITDAGIDRLHDGESLMEVTLNGTSITLDGFERLRTALPEAKLQVSDTKLIQTFCKSDGHSLWLEDRQQVDSLLQFLALPHDWRTGEYAPPSGAPVMTLKGPAVGPALADILAAMPNANSVFLAQTSITGGFEAASDSVRGIYLSELTGAVDLSSLASVESMEILEIGSTPIPEGLIATLSELPSLRVLSFYTSPLPAGELQSLPLLPALRGIGLGGIMIAEADLLAIAECESLNGVSFSTMEVPDEVAEAVAALPNLTHLTLYRTSVSPEIIETIRARHPDLQLRAE